MMVLDEVGMNWVWVGERSLHQSVLFFYSFILQLVKICRWVVIAGPLGLELLSGMTIDFLRISRMIDSVRLVGAVAAYLRPCATYIEEVPPYEGDEEERIPAADHFTSVLQRTLCLAVMQLIPNVQRVPPLFMKEPTRQFACGMLTSSNAISIMMLCDRADHDEVELPRRSA